ncbi:tetratricopeptide repeat protein [Aquimarina pacifica]|uniref:tetratricopeptide repeat protein n=1 Tax=Aquimarina pacifica TaxID=1296415 RepID=UPI001376700D|nr:tetratricopeptide repeat protein [Aquimarina pacifica]
MKHYRKIILLFFFISIKPTLFSQIYQHKEQEEKRHVDETFRVLELELKTAQEKNIPSEIAYKFLQLGEFYQKARVYNEAILHYNHALGVLKKNDTLVVHLQNEIGKIQLSLKNVRKAIIYFNKSLAISLANDYLRGAAITKGLLGSCYEKQGEYLKALQYQKESLELFTQISYHAGIAKVHENMGSIYEDLEQYDLAYEYFEKSDQFFAKINTIDRISVLNNLGDINRKTNNYHKALMYTQMAYELSNQFNDKHQLRSAHKDLSKTYKLTGNYKEALDHLLKSEHINDELTTMQNVHQLNTLQTIYETKQKEAQINLLLQQGKVSRAHQNLLWVSLGTTVIIAIILFLYFRKKRIQNTKLQEYKERALKVEIEKKAFEEKNLQKEVHVKTAALSRYSLHLSQKNKMLYDVSQALTNIANRKNFDQKVSLKKIAQEINFNLHQEKEWDEFNNFFKEIHPAFIKKLSALSEEKLSPAELRLGMLLRLNLSSKEIASILRVTPDSVRVARYRLRKKLPIAQKEELVSFMIDL